MSRSGPGFPAWAFAGFCLGCVSGFVGGYILGLAAGESRSNARIMAVFIAGGGAAGGAVVGAVRDILAYLSRRFPSPGSHEADYRDPPG